MPRTIGSNQRFTMRKMSRNALALSSAGALLVLAACAEDQTEDPDAWPENNIRWVVPASAGGGFDEVARTLQPFLEDELGTNFEMDNQPGADNAVGTQVVAESGQDCETVLIAGVPHILYGYLTQDVTYEYEEDFYPAGALQFQPSAIIVNEDAPWDSLSDLIDDAEDRPGEIVVASGQFTSANYTGMLDLMDETGVEFNMVNYGTGGDARTAVVSGEADMMHTPVFSALGVSDEVRFLAVHQDENSWADITDNAPTVNEELDTEVSPSQSMYGLFAHAECRDEHPERFEALVEATAAAMENEEYLERIEELEMTGGLPDMTNDEMHDHILAELEDVQRFVDERPEFQESE